jgi:hypothetical protein
MAEKDRGGEIMRLRLVMAAALVVGLVAGAAYSDVEHGRDSVVTEVRIDDEGVRIGHRDVSEYPDSDRQERMKIIGEDIIRFGDDVIVEEGEVVEGDAVAILGSVLVEGAVEGDAVAVGGSVTVGPKGEIDGDGVAIGGGVTKEGGGVVHGETVSVGRGQIWKPRGRFLHSNIFFPAGRLLFFILWTILLIVLAMIVIALAKGPVENVRMRATREAFKMGLIGLLAEVLLVPVMVLFIITIIGIPIGLVVLPLVFGLAVLFGFISVSLAVGQRAGNGAGRGPYTAVAVGILLLHALVIIGGVLRLPGGGIGLVGAVLKFIGYAVIYVAGTVGLGAVIMSKFGSSRWRGKEAVVTAPSAQMPQV